MKGPFEADDDATPITPAEREALIPTHVTLRSELNELEQQNIAEANAWAFERKRNVLDEAFLRGLHRRMFNNVWRWAGEYRRTERNLGVPPHLIQPELIQAIDDARFGSSTNPTSRTNWPFASTTRPCSCIPFRTATGAGHAWRRFAGHRTGRQTL